MPPTNTYIRLVIGLILLQLVAAQLLPNPLPSKISKDRLQSGPIFLLDTRLILITQFSYVNKWWKNVIAKYNKWFRGQLANGTLIALEFDTREDAQIKTHYYGSNIILRVPLRYDYTVRDLNNLMIMNDKDQVKTLVPIPESNKENLPDHSIDSPFQGYTNMYIYPTCCNLNVIPNDHDEFCLNITEDDIKYGSRIPIHDVRHKNYNLTPFDETELHRVPYYSHQTCDLIELEEDFNAKVLKDGQVIVKQFPYVQLACIYWIKIDDGRFAERVFSCVENFDMSSGHNLHAQFYYIFYLFISVIYFIFL